MNWLQISLEVKDAQGAYLRCPGPRAEERYRLALEDLLAACEAELAAMDREGEPEPEPVADAGPADAGKTAGPDQSGFKEY